MPTVHCVMVAHDTGGADRADAGVRRSGAVGDRKSNQRQGETDLLTLIAHLCYNKDTDEAHEIAVHGLHLIAGYERVHMPSQSLL